MKNEKVMKHNIRRIFSVIAIILTVILLCLCAKNYASADDLADMTARNDLFEAVLEAGGTIEEAREARYKLYCEQNGLPYTPPNERGNGDTTETVPHNPPKETEKHEHNYVPTVSKEATCSETGTMTYSCTCGKSYTEDIKKTEHKYMPGTVEMGTCIKKRTEHFTCSICGDSYKVEGEYGDHLYFPDAEASRDATCNDFGKKVKVCNECGDVVEEVLPMVDHGDTVETVITEATCTENGKKHLVCSVCGKVMKVEVIPFTGHIKSDTSEVVTEPTFTSKGLEHYKCINCGMVMEEKEIPSECFVFLSSTTGKVTTIAGIGVVAVIIILIICLPARNRKRRKEKDNEETTHH